MSMALTRARYTAWLPWVLLLIVSSMLQVTGSYPGLRLNLSANDSTWWYTSFTCHLVHLTTRHWLYNSLALVVIGGIFVRQYTWPIWLLTYAISAISISLGLHWFPHDLHSYAGLSGLLHGLFVMGVLRLYPQQPRLASLLGLLVLLKLLMDATVGSVVLKAPGFTVASMAHVYGAIGGLLSWLSVYLWRISRVA